jgi:hypothetical protein
MGMKGDTKERREYTRRHKGDVSSGRDGGEKVKI